jgi:hypothetical protein
MAKPCQPTTNPKPKSPPTLEATFLPHQPLSLLMFMLLPSRSVSTLLPYALSLSSTFSKPVGTKGKRKMD